MTKPKLRVVREDTSCAGTRLLKEKDVVYLQYLLSGRDALRAKIKGVLVVGGDASSLMRVLKATERKLRERGIRVDSFYNGSHYE